MSGGMGRGSSESDWGGDWWVSSEIGENSAVPKLPTFLLSHDGEGGINEVRAEIPPSDSAVRNGEGDAVRSKGLTSS